MLCVLHELHGAQIVLVLLPYHTIVVGIWLWKQMVMHTMNQHMIHRMLFDPLENKWEISHAWAIGSTQFDDGS